MTDIFTQDETTIPENPLEALVGEGKKFSTPADLARAKLEADQFIEQLKRENAEMRKEVAEKLTMDELLTKIRQPNTEVVTPSPDGQNGKPDLKTNDLEALIAKSIEQREAYNKSQGNMSKVEAKLAEVWGDQAANKLQQKARELGVSTEELKSLAIKSPELLYNALGLNAPKGQPFVSPPASKSHLPAPSSGTRDQAYYDNLRQTNKALYFDAKTQLQYMKDALKNPEAFGINR